MAGSSAKRKEIARRLSLWRSKGGAVLTPEVEGWLREALCATDRDLIVSACRITGEQHANALEPDLARAFERLLRDPLRSDKGCIGKMAIVDALLALEVNDPKVFLAGIRHRQMEPVWGERVDTAGNLRAHCALGLAHMAYPEVFFELTTLLADAEVEARRGAIRALKHLAAAEAELLLRLKALHGDVEPEVVGECLSALMAVEPTRSLEFVAGFLNRDDLRLAEEAAYALGESRTEAAFALLVEKWERVLTPSFRKMLLMPIALTRREGAFALLMDALTAGPADRAVAAIEALRLVCSDEARLEAVAQAVRDWDDPGITRAWRAVFADT